MDLKAKTITELHDKLVAKEVSAVELLQGYLAETDAKNPELNAVITDTREQAKAAAEKVDAALARGEEISKIAGIPAMLKDNFNWTGTRTTASSKILDNYISPYNATVTERLLAEDVVFIGKTNMDAFAHGSSTETSDYGPTLNPYDHSRSAGGSSGGSGAAVAADMSCYAIGSETAGSVRGPAAWCNLYGFAPTYGRTSRYGVVAMGSSLDRPGVLANSVTDCAIITDIIAGQDEHDATTIPEPRPAYTQSLNANHTQLKIGIPKQFLDDRIDPQVAARVREVLQEYEKLGAKLIEIDLLDPKYSMAVYTIVCRSEVSSNLARIDGIRYGHWASSAEASEAASDKAFTILDQIAHNRGEGFGNEAKQRSMTGAFALSSGYYDAYYKKAQQVRTLIIDDFKQAFTNVDLIMGPTMPTVAPKLGVTANNPLFGELADVLTEPSALAGLPCISIPVGFNDEKLPIGMQIFGPQYQEQQVLNAAYIFEQRINK
jgi:aspartyl-tRNA(Asn)/glutamyl-tRNA(Gln) amidotransferase subunit A